MILLSLACQDQGFSEIRIDAIATSMGDFDDVSQVLSTQEIGSSPYNGYIAQATWDTSDERPTRDDPGLTIEELLSASDDQGKLEIDKYNALFVNSGTRGLGAVVYNDPSSTDDSVLLDSFMLANIEDFVSGGGTLVATDWAYDLVEALWPDAIEFAGDDLVADAAQLGRAGDFSAEVLHEEAAEAVGGIVSLTFDYSAWAVMESVGGDTEVLLRGDIEYQPDESQGYQSLSGVPLAVRFASGGGQVVYASFPWLPQTPAVAQGLVMNLVEGLSPGTGESEEDSGG